MTGPAPASEDPSNQRGASAVTELRVHGVGGPSAADVLETSDPIPLDGAGKSLAGFFGRDEPGPEGQKVEAFIWGGLTSRSGMQVLWWVLLPFSLVNVAGWMVYAERDRNEEPGDDEDHSPLRDRFRRWTANGVEIAPLRWLIRWAGVLMTLVYVLWIAVIVFDIVAVQCGGEPDCVNRPFLLPLRWFEGNAMWRLTVGGAALFLVLILILYGGRLTHRRYEEYEPDPIRRTMEREPRPVRCNDNLRHPRFWYNWEEWYRTFRVHGIWGAAFAAGIVAYGVAFAESHLADFEKGTAGASLTWTIIAAVATLGALGWVLRPPRVDDRGVERTDRWQRMFGTFAFLAIALAAGAVAGWQLFARRGVARTIDPLAAVGVVGAAAVALILVRVGVGRLLDVRANRADPQHAVRSWGTLRRTAAALAGVAVIGFLWALVLDRPAPMRISPLDNTPLEGGLGTPTAVAWLFAAEVGLLLVGALLVIKNNWLRIRWKRIMALTPPVGDRFRLLPPAAAVVTGFAIASAGFGALTIRIVDYLDGGGEELRLGAAESGHLASPGLGVDIFAFAAVLGLLATVVPMLRGLFKGYEKGVQADYPTRPDSISPFEWNKFTGELSRARVTSQVGRNVDRFLTGFMLGVIIAGGVVIYQAYQFSKTHLDFDRLSEPFLGVIGGDGEDWTESIRTMASWGLLLYVFPGVQLIRAGRKDHATRRQIGKVWDSITFFPRRFHPLGAPCYAERAVPMLREHLRDKAAAGESVVIRAHSQGTVLSVAAIAQLIGEAQPIAECVTRASSVDEPGVSYEDARVASGGLEPHGHEVLDKLALVTLGSPLGQLHSPFFPDYFSPSGFKTIRGTPSSNAPDLSGRWENFYRETDYIGKAIFVHPEIALDIDGRFFRDYRQKQPKADMKVPEDEGWAGQDDRPDPNSRQPRPPPPDHSVNDPTEPLGEMRRHSGYHLEQPVIDQISAYVKQLAPPTAGRPVTSDPVAILEAAMTEMLRFFGISAPPQRRE